MRKMRGEVGKKTAKKEMENMTSQSGAKVVQIWLRQTFGTCVINSPMSPSSGFTHPW